MDYEYLISERIKSIKESASMSMNEKISKSNKDMINFTIGQPDFNPPRRIIDHGIDAFNNNQTKYTNSRGIPQLLKLIINKLREENKIKVESEKNILVTPGLKQALYYINASLINPGDEAIIFEPYWLTYVDSLVLCGGIPVTIMGDEENDFKPTIVQIKERITDKTKYILFSNPCNPTGTFWSKDELQEILEVAKQNDILIISDEIYEKILFDHLEYASIASLEGGEKYVLTLNGFSKGQAIPGLRIGYIMGPEKLISSMFKMHQQIATCTSSVSQFAALESFNVEDEIKKMVKEYQERRDVLVEGLNNIEGIRCHIPKGTFYTFANISGLGMDSLRCTEFLFDKASVGVVPGIAYGENCNDYIRFSFATSMDNIKKGIKNIKESFKK